MAGFFRGPRFWPPSAPSFPRFLETGGSATSETIHSRASAFATIAIVILALAYATPIALPQRPVVSDPVGKALAVVAVVLVGISTLLHETRWTGLGQRALWLVLIIWLVRTTWQEPSRRLLWGHSG